MPRVATGQSANPKHRALERTVNSNRLLGVTGAAGVETTIVSKQAAQATLVNCNKADQKAGQY